MASWFKIWEGDTLDGKIGSIVLALGFFIFALHQTIGMPLVVSIMPAIAMIVVAAAGIAALMKGRKTLGMWLLLGVLFASLATFRGKFVSDLWTLLTSTATYSLVAFYTLAWLLLEEQIKAVFLRFHKLGLKHLRPDHF